MQDSEQFYLSRINDDGYDDGEDDPTLCPQCQCIAIPKAAWPGWFLCARPGCWVIKPFRREDGAVSARQALALIEHRREKIVLTVMLAAASVTAIWLLILNL